MSSNPEDQYDLELSHVIDLYQNQSPIKDDGSEYFGWSDEDTVTATEDTSSIAQIDESQFLDLTTPIVSPITNEVNGITPTDVLNDGITRPIQLSDFPKPPTSRRYASTTQNIPEIPHTAASTTPSISTDVDVTTTVDGEIPELDLAGRLHKIFLENRVEETVTVIWAGSDNSTRPSAWVLQKIDEVFAAWLDVIDSKGKLVVKLRGGERRMLRASRSQQWVWRNMVYPGPCARDNRRFGAFVRLLELVREAIESDKIYTKRDIYYKDVALFGSQQTVDSLVDDVSSALGVPRRSLHITAAAKGLVCGDLSIFKTDGSIIDCNIEGEGVLIPSSADIEKVEIRDTDTVLIIEKEGKGYPDIATREFSHYLYLTKNHTEQYLDFYCLVDYDPHGLDIYTMYKNGSLMSRAAGMFYEQMAVPGLRHLGVRFCDILEYCSGSVVSGVGEGDGEEPRSKRVRYSASSLPPQGLLPMTAHDRAKAVSMLQRDHDVVGGGVEYTEDLRKLLFVGYKAEIQVLGEQLVRYLDEKLGGQRIGLAS
ncbi:hypothetical protein TWF481_008165 [Arthrobotrys musiformis]|uniref:DNA topoisomerase (ATP-hydrolyzing) n=1 Tax=Arthrobotrys musiformis TaxID=47236 RepID=A0AAV9W6A1_9PEZI